MVWAKVHFTAVTHKEKIGQTTCDSTYWFRQSFWHTHKNFVQMQNKAYRYALVRTQFLNKNHAANIRYLQAM